MLFTARNLKTTTTVCVVMALTIFLMRGFSAEIEFTVINLVPFLFSAFCGGALAFLYLMAFPRQKKVRFFTFFIPGVGLLTALIISGLSDFWLVEELMFLLSFVFGAYEISKPAE